MCPHCKKIYAPRSLLRKHMQFACKMNPRNTTTFSCTFCPYKSIYKANMERHVSNVHNTGSLKFSCELCNFRTLSWHSYSSLHKKITCNSDKDMALHNEKKHTVIVRKRIYICTDCGKGFTLRIKLLKHRKLECINL
ncbi:PREDICTED: oocyte zinc finger protein XlCOF26-like [Cyphomyrmex costatus]|uniref:oocyte zinc finger protein XlCOF26-like n=1 Tax=Cyphomyrmex costatus TaxID=456900 RepID=UPI00085231A8|nr:PREDICTED: oocyte zinc finger protein XlCOF26-like [Cyphomyrmex costatus]